jgi:hypothetical protein
VPGTVVALGAAVAVSAGTSTLGVSTGWVSPGLAVGVREGGGGGSVSRAPGASELHARLTTAASASTNINLNRAFNIVSTLSRQTTSF